jgi:hypothetical protein
MQELTEQLPHNSRNAVNGGHRQWPTKGLQAVVQLLTS